jgi:hypothetical protein
MENRIGAEMNAWAKREERFEKLFPGTLKDNRPFLLEKLNYLYRLQVRFGNSINDDERLTLSILRQQRQVLEKKLFPSLLRRLLNRIVIPVIQRRQLQKDAERLSVNHQKLISAVTRAGLTEIIPALKRKLKEGEITTSLSHTCYINPDDRVDLKIGFRRDNLGEFLINNVECAIKGNDQSSSLTHNFKFDQWGDFDLNMAYNLLKGRPVLCINTNDEIHEPVWKQFYLNDKDSDGNFRMKEFPIRYEFDIEKELKKLPIKEHDIELSDKLKAGNQVEVMGQVDGRAFTFHIAANPQLKSIDIFDEGLKKTSIKRLEQRAISKGEKLQESKVIKLSPPKMKIHRSHSKGIS